MRCFTILAIVFAISADCLAQNVEVLQTIPRSDGSRAKLCELILQKLDLQQQRGDEKTVIPLDNIISLTEIIKKFASKESDQPDASSYDYNNNGRSAYSSLDPTGCYRKGSCLSKMIPKIPKVPKIPKIPIKVPPGIGGVILDTIPSVIDLTTAVISQPNGNSTIPTERRISVNPPPIEPRTRISMPQISSEEVQLIGKTKKAIPKSNAKVSTFRAPEPNEPGIRDPLIKYAAKPIDISRQDKNDTFALLKQLMSKTNNVKVKSLLRTLIQDQKAMSRVETRENRIPPGNLPPSKKSDRSKKENSKDVVVNRLALDDIYEPQPRQVVQHIPRRTHSKVTHEDANVNKNVNINTNAERDKLKMLRSSSRRTLFRPHRHHDHDHHEHGDKNENHITNINKLGEDLPSRPIGRPIDEYIPYRRALDHSVDENINSNVNTNLNHNSNINRQMAPQNKRRGRDSWQLM